MSDVVENHQTTECCAMCGEPPEWAAHSVDDTPMSHAYVPQASPGPPASATTLDPNSLVLLTSEEKKMVRWIKEFWQNPQTYGGLATLQDCGLDIIKDLLEFLARYGEQSKRLIFAEQVDRDCD